jgi:hypothetical protein
MEMADWSAMASGLESNWIGSGGGGNTPTWSVCACVKVFRCCEKLLEFSAVARRAGGSVGVMGLIGGRAGELDRDRGCEPGTTGVGFDRGETASVVIVRPGIAGVVELFAIENGVMLIYQVL